MYTRRGIGGAPLAQALTAKRDADTMQIFGEIGYDIAAGNTAVTPFVRLAHVDTGSDAFTETGGNAALTVGKADQKTTRSEEHTSELQSLMRISYAVFCLKKTNTNQIKYPTHHS